MNNAKSVLRQHLLQRRKALPDQEVIVHSLQICAQIRQLPEWGKAKTILMYYPHENEVNLLPLAEELIKAGKIVAFPKVDPVSKSLILFSINHLKHDFHEGFAGIAEPKEACSIVGLPQVDLILVPGVGFDQTGNRLGRGKGYYDVLLKNTSAIKIGIGYDFQLFPKILVEKHDVPMQFLITEKRCRTTKLKPAN